jgi:hypothetical protein
MITRRIVTALLTIAALVSGLLAVSAVTAGSASASLFSPCTPLLAGQIRVVGRYPNSFLIECVHIKGLGWWWVSYFPGCRAVTGTAPARQAAAC